MTEQLVLRKRDGTEVPCRADVTRYSAARASLRAGAVVTTAFGLGAVSILVPGLHFVSVWALPLLGLGLGWYLLNVRARVGRVEATCPDCRAAIAIDRAGNVGGEPLWLRCPGCNVPLELKL